jgi:hypothetical protein
LRIVKLGKPESGMPEQNWPKYFEPADARIDPRATRIDSLSLKELRIVRNIHLPESDFTLHGGAFKIQAGYNTVLQALPDENAVRIEFVPGEGQGVYPGCQDEPSLYMINDVTPDKFGRLIIKATDCYAITAEENRILLRNDCKVCCECSDYVKVYEAIRRLFHRYKELAKRAELARQKFIANIQRWELARECRRKQTLRAITVALPECRLAVAAGVCNQSDFPLKDVRVRITFYGPRGCVICNTVYRRGNVDVQEGKDKSHILKPYTLEGEWPTYEAAFECIHPATNGYVMFLVQYDHCTGKEVKIVVELLDKDRNVLEYIEKAEDESILFKDRSGGDCCKD